MRIRTATKKDIREIAKLMLGEFSKPPFNEKTTINSVIKSLNFYFKIGKAFVVIEHEDIVGIAVDTADGQRTIEFEISLDGYGSIVQKIDYTEHIDNTIRAYVGEITTNKCVLEDWAKDAKPKESKKSKEVKEPKEPKEPKKTKSNLKDVLNDKSDKSDKVDKTTTKK